MSISYTSFYHFRREKVPNFVKTRAMLGIDMLADVKKVID